MGIRVEAWQAPDSSVRSEEWLQPGPLTVENGRLVHDHKAWSRKMTFTGVGPGMLEGFLALAAAPDARIATYAGRWGFLDLCQHDIPTESGATGKVKPHPWPRLPPYLAVTGLQVISALGECQVPPPRNEPISTWRYWSNQAVGLAGIGLSLANRRAVDRRDVARLLDLAPWVPDIPGDSRQAWDDFKAERPVTSSFLDLRDIERNRLARLARAPSMTPKELTTTVQDALDFWLDMSRVSLRLRWSRGGPDTYFTGGLFAALGIQLLMAITGRQGFAVCGGCGVPHVPVRPNDKRASFCANCRGKVPRRLAAQRYEAKRRARRHAERTAP